MNVSSIRVDSGKLYVGDRHIDLLHPVGEMLRYHGLVIVRVEPPPGVLFNRNVIAFKEAGERDWQIEESPHGTELDKPYVGIRVDVNGDLIASNWNGVDYRVNPDNGSVQVKAFNK